MRCKLAIAMKKNKNVNCKQVSIIFIIFIKKKKIMRRKLKISKKKKKGRIVVSYKKLYYSVVKINFHSFYRMTSENLKYSALFIWTTFMMVFGSFWILTGSGHYTDFIEKQVRCSAKPHFPVKEVK